MEAAALHWHTMKCHCCLGLTSPLQRLGNMDHNYSVWNRDVSLVGSKVCNFSVFASGHKRFCLAINLLMPWIIQHGYKVKKFCTIKNAVIKWATESNFAHVWLDLTWYNEWNLKTHQPSGPRTQESNALAVLHTSICAGQTHGANAEQHHT